jgi:hypothetical protein
MDKATEGSIMEQQEDTAWEIALIMDKATANDKRLTFTDKIVFAYIQGFTRNGKWCFATSETIANRFGLAAPYVRQSRSKLEKLGLLRREVVKGRTSFRSIIQKPQPPEPVSENLTVEEPEGEDAPYSEIIAVINSDAPVRNSYSECKKILHPVSENLTHNNNININIKENYKSDHARAREGATGATGESFLKKEKEGEQPRKLTNQQQMEQNYKAGQRSIAEIDAQIRAEGRDPDAKMSPEVAKQKFAELMATIARRKSS